MRVEVKTSTLHALSHLTVAGLARDVEAFVVVWVAVLAIGLALNRALLRRQCEDPLTEVAAVLGLGIVGYGAAVLVLGLAHLLHRGPLALLTLASIVLFVWVWRSAVGLVRRLGVLAASGLRLEWYTLVPAIAVFGVGALAAFRPPQTVDEVQYHWAAPLLWAKAGGLVTSPFKFTNGFDLAEIFYTPEAVFHSSTAAHWSHLTTLLLLSISTAVLARRFGGRGTLALTAVIAMPAAYIQSYIGYNDVFAASLLVAACAVVVGRPEARTRWTAGILLAGALSVKPVLIFMAPLVALFAASSAHEQSGRWNLKEQMRALAPTVVPSVAAAIGWLGFTRSRTGHWFQSKGLVLGHHGSLALANGHATLRVPSLVNLLEIPFLPMATGVIGAAEPYGGRSSLVLTVFIPVMIVCAVLMDSEARRRLGRLAVPAALVFLESSILVVKTRYLLSLYAVGLAAATVALAWCIVRSPRDWGFVLLWTFRLLVVIGLLDGLTFALGS
jgi:hypothetical protein